MRLMVGVAFVAIAVVTCFVTLSSTGTGLTEPQATVNKDYTGKPDELKEALTSATALFDPGHRKEDCTCKSECKLDTKSKVSGVGVCTIDLTKDPEGKCIGFDFKYAKFVATDKSYTAACELTKGRYDCYEFPCQNGGHCVDGIDDYTCVCEFGWKDKNCQTDINECNFKFEQNDLTKKENFKEVCDRNAECRNKVVDDVDKKGYECICNRGWDGDGFQKDQKGVKFGSILKSTGRTHSSWLDRSAKDYSRAGCFDIDDCSPNPCSPQLPEGKKATCTDEGAVEFSCSCASLRKNINQAWKGRKEGEDGLCDQDVKECSQASLNNCESANKAICHETRGSFECSCREGWFGDGYRVDTDPKDWGKTGKFTGCQDVDDCKVAITNDKGEVTGYKSPCVRGTCSNVQPGSGKFHCECPNGWEGKICDVDIDECTRWDGKYNEKEKKNNPMREDLGCDFPKAECVNTDGSYYCFCHEGFTGNGYSKGVRKILKGLVDPKGAVTSPGCVDADDCEFKPCKNGATCTDRGTLAFECTCVIGWKGKTCEEDWNECRMGIHTCHEAAKCLNTPGSFECSCEKGYSGDGYRMCERMDNCFDWEDGPADDNTLSDYAHKIYKKQTKEEIAAGKPLELDLDATKKYTFDRGIKSNLIKKAPWQDDIRLMAFDAALMAKGVKKLVKVEKCGVYKADGTPRTFAKHGNCRDIIAEGVYGMFVCDCDAGWGDKQCDRDINECTEGLNECHRYATCTNTPGSYTCECNPGHTGDGIGSCHDIDDCTTKAACKYGFCTDLGANDFRCTCMEGYTDKLCDEDIDECGKMTHECNPEYATCTNTRGSYTCKCNTGFQGTGIGPDSCEDMNDCASSPCEHGNCTDLGADKYACTCDDGWKDFNCDYDRNECNEKTHNCHETGKCVNSPGGFFCRCVSGFQGDGYTCTDLDDCDPDPCHPEHGHCSDKGQNSYFCRCDPGWKGTDCSVNINECTEKTHSCHEFSNCFDKQPFFDCACKDEYWGPKGENNMCTRCTDCSTKCPEGTGYGCGTGPGYYTDPKTKECEVKDRRCLDKNECDGTNNCDLHATCANTKGSFTCTCVNEECKARDWVEYPPQCMETAKCYYGIGTTNQCAECVRCGGGQAPIGHALGDYMFKEGTSTSNRVCKPIVEDGWYALETYQGGVAQCLVKWKADGKVFPERYAWGGDAEDRSKKTEDGKLDGMQAADICHTPICGVCDWDGKTAAKNVYDGKEAAWALKRLDDDLYVIMNRADNKGLRCLGFQSVDAPYPQLITYVEEPVQDADGVCYKTDTKTKKPTSIVRKGTKTVKCNKKTKCGKDEVCKYASSMVGSWSMNAKGGSDPATYYCGFQAHGAASAAQRLKANGAAVWSVHALGCRGKWCEKRLFDRQFTLRSLVRGDANKDSVVDAKDYECLYFPEVFVGQTTSPSRVPKMGSRSSPSSQFGWQDEDTSKDPDCGIRLTQYDMDHKACKCVGPTGVPLPDAPKSALKCAPCKVNPKSPECTAAKAKGTSGTMHWVCPDESPYSQERALVKNKQATWKLTFLQYFDV